VKQTNSVSAPASAAANPLFCALAAGHLPIEFGTRPAREEEEEAGVIPKIEEIQRWFARAVKPRASGMHAAVAYLTDAADIEFGVLWKDRRRGQRVMGEMLDYAAMVYVHSLRVFLLGNLQWWLQDGDEDDGGLKKKLLTPAQPGRVTAWSETSIASSLLHCTTTTSNTSETTPPEGRETGTETSLPITWRANMSGRWVRAKLQQELGVVSGGSLLPRPLEEIWNMLLTPTTAELAGRYLRFDPERVSSGNSLDVLWELLVAAEREGTPKERRPVGVDFDDDDDEVDAGGR
jgi:hypothetical protein